MKTLKTFHFLACGLLCVGIGVLRASAASATVPAPDRSTPVKSLIAMIDAAQAEDYATVRATYSATTKPAIAAADDMAHTLVSLHRFTRVMDKHFPGQKALVSDMGSDLNLQQSHAELAKITFTIQGNHATASREFLGGDFVFDGHIWQINYDCTDNIENYLNEKAGTGMATMRLIARTAPELDAIAADIESGKLKTYDEVAKIVRERTSKLSTQMEKEFTDLQAAAALDLSTPEKTMAAYLKALETENRFALRATLAATTKPGAAWADDCALLIVSNHRFHRVLDKKFPDHKQSVILEMAGTAQMTKMRDGIAKMTFTINGNHATASDDALGMTLILTGKTWQLDFDNLRGYEKYPQNNGGDTAAMMYMLARYVPAWEAVADDIEAGKLADIDAVKQALEERCAPIQERVEKELKAPPNQPKPSP